MKIGLGTVRGLWAFLGAVAVVMLAATPSATASSEASKSAEAPVVEQLLDLLRAKGDISHEQYEELLKKAREEESANQEKKAQPQAAAASASKTKVTTNYDGLKVTSPDGRFKLNVGGRIQADWNVFDQDITPLGDGMELRRARLKAQGTMYDHSPYERRGTAEG